MTILMDRRAGDLILREPGASVRVRGGGWDKDVRGLILDLPSIHLRMRRNACGDLGGLELAVARGPPRRRVNAL